MNGTQNLNLDTQTLEQCLMRTNKFGETVYTNICNGQINTIPWGGFDWLLVIVADWLLVIVLVGVGIFFILPLFLRFLDKLK